jgi:hypothetical protein
MSAGQPLSVEEAKRKAEAAGLDAMRTTGGFIGAGELCALDLPPLPLLVEGLLTADGSGFIAGEEKVGKTMLALHLAVALALGLPVGARFPASAPVRVLFVEEEDSVRRTRQRLRKLLRGFGLDPDAREVQARLNAHLHIAVWVGLNLDDERGWAQLEAELAPFQPNVLFLDCLSRVTTRDLKRQELAAPLFRRFDDLRRRYGVLLFLLHHYRKQQGERTGRGSQELMGSFVLGAWAEQSVFLEAKDRTGKLVAFELQSKDLNGLPAPLRVVVEDTPDTLTLRLDDFPTTASAAERVWEAMGTAPPSEAHTGYAGISVATLVAKTKLSDKTIRAALTLLVSDGRCLEVGRTSKQAKLYARNE